MVEQANSNSPLGKAIEKQTKTIKDQGGKQIESIKDNKKQLAIINWDYKNKLLLSKEREIFKNIYTERLDKIKEVNKAINYKNLKYTVISTGEEFEFDNTEDPLVFFNDVKTGTISLEEAKKITKTL